MESKTMLATHILIKNNKCFTSNLNKTLEPKTYEKAVVDSN